jgi:hypothetical protein
MAPQVSIGRLFDGRHLVAPLDDVVGLAEARLHVAVAELLVVVLAVIDELVRRVDVEHHGRAGLHRLLDVEDMGERFPLHPHRLHGGARLRLGLGDHRRHGLALVADLVGRQDRLVVDPEVEKRQERVEVERHIRPSQDADDARHPLGLRRVDPPDAGGVVRRTDAAQMQEAVEQVVVEERRPAGDMAHDVLPACGLADLVEVVVALVGEEVLAELDHAGLRHLGHARTLPSATARIAAMIGS